MIETGSYIALGIVLTALAITFVRLIKGPSLPDRIISLDLIASTSIGIIIIFNLISKERLYLDIALISSPIIFLGTVTVAIYLKRKRKK